MADKPDFLTRKKVKQMLDTIATEARYTAGMTGRLQFAERVMQAIAEVPRDKFVPKTVKVFAFNNGPLSIGHGQTISQPYIVALMTDMIELNSESEVLEIGTGSGYQTAILSLLAKQVYSIERIEPLYQAATTRLKELGYDNIETYYGNGYFGLPDKAPFDAIIVTAAASHIPQALIEQLKPGGRMIIPVGQPYMHQELLLVIKDLEGNITTESLMGVAFVPLVNEDDAISNQS